MRAVTPSSLFYGFDALGSTRFLMDGSGTVADQTLWSAFGQSVWSSGSDLNRFGYGGNAQYWIVSAGIVGMQFRGYDTATNTWIGFDPIGYRGGDWNWFRYVGNNPTTRTDPSGLDWFDNLSNFAAGTGDTLSFGITDWIRGKIGVNDVVDYGSSAYIGGQITGIGLSTAIGGAGGAEIEANLLERGMSRSNSAFPKG